MLLSDWKICEEEPFVYGIKNVITNMWYIGSCIDLRDRLHRHYYALTHNEHHSMKLQEAWNTYGEKNFEVHILRRATIAEIEEMKKSELCYINEYDSVNNGYNMVAICRSQEHFEMSDEQKHKAGRTHWKPVVGINRWTGKIVGIYSNVSEAARAVDTSTTNVSQVCKHNLRYIKGTVFVYANEYDKSKDYRILKHHMKDVPKSEEWKRRARISNARKEKTYKYDDKGNLLETYDSIKIAAEANHIEYDKLRYMRDKIINGIIFTNKLKI